MAQQARQVSGRAGPEAGIPAPDAPMAGPEKLLVAKQKGTSLTPGSLAEPHTFVLPPHTAGEAKLQHRSQPVAISQVPPPPPCYALPFLAPTPPFSTPYMVPSVQLPQEPGPSQVVPGSSQIMLLNMPSATQALTSGQSNVPYTTQQNRERQEEREQSGSGKRKSKRQTPSFAKSATKTGSHQPTYSTLAIGSVKNQRAGPMRTGGCAGAKRVWDKKRGDAP
ncbi:protein transport protein Sec24-like CEF [Gymnodraco acuticeps]|uniref:Protein transport protein Sec24-like CEF n=1 Tax=Gymnodraco acuticeps TaxID=8218 RepID=A0A6P8VR50_GYMAC|nr:protein transport protein Sec24-like CEF [Gymnodraco acuticeps]